MSDYTKERIESMVMRHNSQCLVSVWPDGEVIVFRVTATRWAKVLHESGATVYEAKIYDAPLELFSKTPKHQGD